MGNHEHTVTCRIFAPNDEDLGQRIYSLFGVTPYNNDGINLISDVMVQFTNIGIELEQDHAKIEYKGNGFLVQFRVSNSGFWESEDESINEIGELYWRLLQKLAQYFFDNYERELTILLSIDDMVFPESAVDYEYEEEEYFDDSIVDLFLPDPYPVVLAEPIVYVEEPLFYSW